MKFLFEDLAVWQKSVDFAVRVIDLAENISTERKHFRLLEQIEASAASVAQNIAEGKGRRSNKEFAQFLYIAKASLNEVITLLIIFGRKGWITAKQLEEKKTEGEEISKMIMGLIKKIK